MATMRGRGLEPWCTCNHSETSHRANGPCRERDSYGEPCGCPSFERDAKWSGDPDPDPEDETPGWDVHDGPHVREPHEQPQRPET